MPPPTKIEIHISEATHATNVIMKNVGMLVSWAKYKIRLDAKPTKGTARYMLF